MKPYYQDNAVTIYHGDCREILPQLEPVDLVLTDPPYAIPTVVAQTRKWTRNVGDLSICESYFRDFMKDMSKKFTFDARLFIFCNQTSYPVLFRAIYGFCDIALLVWDKQRIGMGGDYRKTFELIMYAWFDGAAPIAKDGNGYSDILKCAPVVSELRLHPAEKPIDLIVSLICRLDTRIILDPFMGSGTTLRAAKDLGRKAIGIEIEEKYCEIAARRMAQEVLNLAV